MELYGSIAQFARIVKPNAPWITDVLYQLRRQNACLRLDASVDHDCGRYIQDGLLDTMDGDSWSRIGDHLMLWGLGTVLENIPARIKQMDYWPQAEQAVCKMIDAIRAGDVETIRTAGEHAAAVAEAIGLERAIDGQNLPNMAACAAGAAENAGKGLVHLVVGTGLDFIWRVSSAENMSQKIDGALDHIFKLMFHQIRVERGRHTRRPGRSAILN